MIKIQQITTVEELYKTNGARTGNVFVDGVVEFLQNEPSHSASACAEYLGVDHHLLAGVVKLFLGLPLKEIIVRWRLFQAMDLLDTHQFSLDEVAAKCGYSDPKCLGTAMKKYHGTTLNTYLTGRLRRNTNYDINSTAEKRRQVMDNANELRQRKKPQA